MLVLYLVPSILTLKMLYDYVTSLEQSYHYYSVGFSVLLSFLSLENKA